jgi:hypothetical protein
MDKVLLTLFIRTTSRVCPRCKYDGIWGMSSREPGYSHVCQSCNVHICVNWYEKKLIKIYLPEDKDEEGERAAEAGTPGSEGP